MVWILCKEGTLNALTCFCVHLLFLQHHLFEVKIRSKNEAILSFNKYCQIFIRKVLTDLCSHCYCVKCPIPHLLACTLNPRLYDVPMECTEASEKQTLMSQTSLVSKMNAWEKPRLGYILLVVIPKWES